MGQTATSSPSAATPGHATRACAPALISPGPIAVATWGFGKLAVEEAARTLAAGGSALDAVEQGVTLVELDNGDQYYVGYGGFPNARGDMELDAAIMDGSRRQHGAVMGLQGCRRAISVARGVMEKTPHSILVGDGAGHFARSRGFERENVLSDEARQEWQKWRTEQVVLSMQEGAAGAVGGGADDDGQHDTIGLICMDAHGNIAAGTSTSGWRFKLPGRVGDSPLIGSGLYADKTAGAAVATGDGEEIMRVCLSFLVVEKMRDGLSPTEACREGIKRLQDVVEGDGPSSGDTHVRMHGKLTAAVLAMNTRGEVGAASTLGPHNVHRGRPAFPYAIWRHGDTEPTVREEAKG